ncbi:MAG: hypothetical protein CMQ41_04105 [Gammaproteobacteria bacterium]|nr:hypothetical protein [Gammaproteobacteria bacterium]
MNCLFPKPSLLLGLVLLFAPSFCLAQTNSIATSNDNLRELQRYQSQLEEFESEFGPFNIQLIEPLSSIINIHAEQENFERVAELQVRQLSIMRMELGIESPDIIPLIRSMIEVQQVLGNWGAVSDHLDHLRSLNGSNYGPESEELLNAMENQAQWLLAEFYLGERRSQSDKFLDAREIYRDISRLAERIYGEDSAALYPWYYKRAYNLAILVQLLNTEDGFSQDFVRDVYERDGPGRLEGRWGSYTQDLFRRIPVVEDRNGVVGEDYIKQGIGYINDIRSIASNLGDLEAEAMADLYRGDFNILMKRSSGRRQFNEAREKLLVAGVDQADIDKFFSNPMPLPVPEFFTRFKDLLSYQERIIGEVEGLPEGVVHLGAFRAWHENARAVLKPISKDPLLRIGLPQYQVDLEFNISSRGVASSVDILSSIPEGRHVTRGAVRAVREMKFRPFYEDGRARRIRDVQMKYFFPQQ